MADSISLDDILKNPPITPEQEKSLPDVVHSKLAHIPIVILIDTSESTAIGNTIVKIRDTINDFFGRIAKSDDEFYTKLRKQGDFCVIRYGGNVETIVPWANGSQLKANLNLYATGETPMGEAIVKSGDVLLEQLLSYKNRGTRAFCGLVFNLTDGKPTDMLPAGSDLEKKKMWDKAQERVALYEKMGSAKNPYAQFVHFTTSNDAMGILKSFAGESPLHMPGVEIQLARVNLLEGADTFTRFIKFIEMSLRGILVGGMDDAV